MIVSQALFPIFYCASRLGIGVIHKASILQVSFMGLVYEAYSTVRGQFEHILHILQLFSVLIL
jgi:hypothetical protein